MERLTWKLANISSLFSDMANACKNLSSFVDCVKDQGWKRDRDQERDRVWETKCSGVRGIQEVLYHSM